MSETAVMKLKKQKVAQIKSDIDNASFVLFLNYRGLTVPEITALRGGLNRLEATAEVNKNTLTRIALKDLEISYPEDILIGPSMMVSSADGVVNVSKVVTDFIRSNEKLQIKGGFLNSQLISEHDVVSLSKLPTREVLLAKFVGQLNAPITSFVGVLSGQMRKLICTLKAIEEKKQEVKSND